MAKHSRFWGLFLFKNQGQNRAIPVLTHVWPIRELLQKISGALFGSAGLAKGETMFADISEKVYSIILKPEIPFGEWYVPDIVYRPRCSKTGRGEFSAKSRCFWSMDGIILLLTVLIMPLFICWKRWRHWIFLIPKSIRALFPISGQTISKQDISRRIVRYHRFASQSLRKGLFVFVWFLKIINRL